MKILLYQSEILSFYLQIFILPLWRVGVGVSEKFKYRVSHTVVCDFINKMKTTSINNALIQRNVSRKNAKISRKCELRKFRENHELQQLIAQKVCYDASISEVLLCHINNFSSFTLTNV